MNKRAAREAKEERKKKIRKKRRRRAALIVIELIILVALGTVAYGMLKLDKLDINIIDKKKLDVYKDTGPYTNIALFGLDSREGEIDGGVQSDAIMIASINNETNDVKIMSVYRDTLLFQANETYGKANSAYNMGGPEEAISLLNRNFDLDIQNYVSVNFSALVDVVDALGGIKVNLTEKEALYCNAYASETAQVIGTGMTPIDEVAGEQLLDGVHAVGYARIRYTDGMDFERAERQRFVLNEVVKKAKKANVLTLNKIIDKVFPKISTSFNVQDMLGFAANAIEYNIVETVGFPYDVTTSENVMNHSGSFVVPIGLANNVTRMHRELFGEADYQPSEKVQAIDGDIVYMTGVTEDTEGINTTFEGDVHNEGVQ